MTIFEMDTSSSFANLSQKFFCASRHYHQFGRMLVLVLLQWLKVISMGAKEIWMEKKLLLFKLESIGIKINDKNQWQQLFVLRFIIYHTNWFKFYSISSYRKSVNSLNLAKILLLALRARITNLSIVSQIWRYFR